MHTTASYEVGVAVVILIVLLVLIGLFWAFRRKRNSSHHSSHHASKPIAYGATFSVQLTGNQEVPPVSTSGTGSGVVHLSMDQTMVHYAITVRNLSADIDPAVGAHFHRGAVGVNGPIVKNLNFQKTTANTYVLEGFWTTTDTMQPLTAENVMDLISGNLYVNVHTFNYPNGEIRGQVMSA